MLCMVLCKARAVLLLQQLHHPAGRCCRVGCVQQEDTETFADPPLKFSTLAGLSSGRNDCHRMQGRCGAPSEMGARMSDGKLMLVHGLIVDQDSDS